MFNLTIVTPEEMIFEGEVRSLKIPGSEGYMEILTHHAPLIATLKEGTLSYTTSNNEQFSYHVLGGFVEVSHNQSSVLADEIQPILK